MDLIVKTLCPFSVTPYPGPLGMALFQEFIGDIIGSIYKMEAAHHTDLTGFAPVEFLAGKGWQQIPFAEENGELRLAVQETDNGLVYAYSGTVAIQRLRPEVQLALLPYLGQGSVLRITDMNDQVYIIGAPGLPVNLQLDGSTGQQFTGRNGYTLSFSISQNFEAQAV